ncbi:MAG: peptidoglycan-binding protein [Proteobacteria bacterium]|nr:peptidoglycan-binding protein [Pseudomonadota bacterium]
MLPLLSACDSLLDAAGLERKAAQEAAPPPVAAESRPAPAPRPRTKKTFDLAGSTKIIDIQNMLNELGYDPGPADGIMGPRTTAAIQDFEVAANMPVDGRVTPALSATLQREYNFKMGIAEAPENKSGTRERKVVLAELDGHDEMAEPDDISQNANEADANSGSGEGSESPSETTAAIVAESPPRPRRERMYSVAEEPHYEVGDNYIYSNGRIETATRIKGNVVHWVVNDGSRYTAVNNFVMPPVEWKGKSGSVQSTVVSSSNVKWPPAKSSEVVFLAKPRDPSAKPRLYAAWSGEWTCGTEGQSTISVPAGRFDVVKIACERTSGSSSQWRRRVWYYSADIRHYVRKEETTKVGGQPIVVDLIAIRPGRSAWSRTSRSGFDWAVQKLLKGGAVGESVDWQVSDSGTEFDITLTGQMKTANNVTCRRYMLVRKKPGQPRIFPALACRDGVSGRWKIPGLEKGSILPADVLAAR